MAEQPSTSEVEAWPSAAAEAAPKTSDRDEDDNADRPTCLPRSSAVEPSGAPQGAEEWSEDNPAAGGPRGRSQTDRERAEEPLC